LAEEIQDQFLGASITDCFIDSPSKIILESSHFKNSCDVLSPLPLYNEHNYVFDNILCSDISIEHTMDID